MPPFEILNILPAADSRHFLKQFCLGSPANGSIPPGPLPLNGWLLAAKQPIPAVLIYCQGSLLRTAMINQPRPDVAQKFPGASATCGFSTSIHPLELPPEFELTLCIEAARQLIPLATITGRHAPETLPDAGALRPLMVTSLGRTGTTYLMRLLSEHPQIVAERTYPYETNAATYWMHLLRVLVQPETPGQPPQPFGRGEWSQPPFVPAPAAGRPALVNYVNEDYPRLAARFCRDAAEQFYRRVAAAQNQPDPLYFCEKFLPQGLQIPFWNLYPQAREIFLARDFRDVVCSVFAFNAKRGNTEFGRDRDSTDEAYIHRFRKACQRLLDNHRARPRSLLVRYEDLIQRGQETLRGIFNYLDLDASDAAIGEVLRRAAADTPELEKHRTSKSPEDSIGRWMRDLTPALQRTCRQTFDDLLPAFGYRLDSASRLIPTPAASLP